MSQQLQGVVADRRTGAEQDHRNALKWYRVLAGCQRIGRRRIPLQEGKCGVFRGQPSAREIE